MLTLRRVQLDTIYHVIIQESDVGKVVKYLLMHVINNSLNFRDKQAIRKQRN